MQIRSRPGVVTDQRPASRGVRAARGALGAVAATLIAAASHALVGGSITWVAVLATAMLALPICTVLAGRVGSLWRLTAAVGAAQGIYHWCFAGLGIAPSGASGADGAGAALPAHAEHLRAVTAFAPQLAATGVADLAMWAAHLAAAAITVLLLQRGERAIMALLRLVRRALPCVVPRVGVTAFPTPVRLTADAAAMHVARILTAASITHRGPPAQV